ncbi:MAG: DUF1858 domain-containing protein [Planctomycetia bacterium]|nr:DUF1858 domain-containing protein [Planctomycetia bacterium]
MITKNIYIEDLVHEYPEVISPLANLGIVCIACGEPVWGTLEELVNKKALNIDEIMAQLGKIINNKDENTK